jgi:hypothetical protein
LPSIFANAAFGYWKVTVERPLRLQSQLTLSLRDNFDLSTPSGRLIRKLNTSRLIYCLPAFFRMVRVLSSKTNLSQWAQSSGSRHGDPTYTGSSERLRYRRNGEMKRPATGLLSVIETAGSRLRASSYKIPQSPLSHPKILDSELSVLATHHAQAGGAHKLGDHWVGIMSTIRNLPDTEKSNGKVENHDR